jgi:hypothetical protein
MDFTNAPCWKAIQKTLDEHYQQNHGVILSDENLGNHSVPSNL